MRRSSKFRQVAISAGKVFNLFPASISFCRRKQLPIDLGISGIWLLVRISQRRFKGRELSGTEVILLALKPTISSSGHSARTFGNSVKSLSEKKAIFSFLSLPKSSGKLLNLLPVRSRYSRVSAKPKISFGNSVSPQDNFSLVVPVSWPE